MEDIEELKKLIAVRSFEKNTEHRVDITHIRDPLNFYTRLTKYKALVQKIETLKSGLKPSSVRVHDIVLFHLNFDGIQKLARGQVCFVEKNEDNFKYDLFAIDYGYFKQSVPSECIWECDKIFLNIPPLALNCQLANCAPRGGRDWGEAIEVFKFYIGNEHVKMIVLDQTSSKLIVKLYNSNPDDIGTLLAITDYTTLGYIHNDINKLQCTSVSRNMMYYHFNEFKTDETVHVRVLSGLTLKAFYVADVRNYKKYLDESDNITYYSKKEPKVDEDLIKPGDPVCVRDWLNKYNRGIIIKILTSSKALVHLVDLGKNEEVNFMNMRKMPKYCMAIPVVAIFCCAEENQAWENGLHRFLYPGFEFIITIKDPGHQFEIPNIVKISPIDDHLQTKSRKQKIK